MSAARPKALLVTDHRAGTAAGYEIRMSNTIAGLRKVADVTIAYLARSGDEQEWTGTDEVIVIPAQQARGVRAYGRGVLTGLPHDVIYTNQNELQAALAPLLAETDLVWLFRARPYQAAAEALAALRRRPPAVVIDFDDLYDDYYRQSDMLYGLPIMRRRAMQAVYKLNSRMWRTHQQKLATAATTVVVTNDDDQRRLESDGVGNVEVIPNGYPVAPAAAANDGACQVLFIGGHHYRPNAAAAELLARQVLPRLRTAIPESELVLVGRRAPVTATLEQLPGVHCYGPVDDLDPVFDRASVVATPVHYGAGSRLKVLEALARRIPLVSSGFACAGFGLVPGQHYLRADTPAETVEAIVELHGDRRLSERLTADSHSHFLEHFSSPVVEQQTADIAVTALGAATAKPPVVT